MKIFVYGTLRQNQANHRLLSRNDAEFLGEGEIEGLLFAGRGAPVAIPGSGVVQGEVYEVNNMTRKRVDRLEGHPNFYERREVTVQMDNGDEVTAQAYMMDKDPDSFRRDSLVEDGDFTR